MSVILHPDHQLLNYVTCASRWNHSGLQTQNLYWENWTISYEEHAYWFASDVI